MKIYFKGKQIAEQILHVYICVETYRRGTHSLNVNIKIFFKRNDRLTPTISKLEQVHSNMPENGKNESKLHQLPTVQNPFFSIHIKWLYLR